MVVHVKEIDGCFQVEVTFYEDNIRKVRITDLIIGNRYIITSPLKSKQKYLEGRECILEDYIEGKHGWIEKLRVRYTDNNRIGKVSISNLKEFREVS